MTDIKTQFMKRALFLAKQARPSPNPRVGAVIVKNGQIIAEGFHKAQGLPHAEIVALSAAGSEAAGADLYVTLEPCSHTGRTGPCVEAIIKSKIARVFVGMKDPDTKVNGQGISVLRNAGVTVEENVDNESCLSLLAGYTIHRTLGRPRVIIKAAITLDGYLAAASGDSKWISSPESRQISHQMRAESDAVLVGSNTIRVDNPLLTVRDAFGSNPVRIVLDSSLGIPKNSLILQTSSEGRVIIVYCRENQNSIEFFRSLPNVELLKCNPNNHGHVEISELLFRLGEMGVLSLLVEGGQKVYGSFLKAKTVDEFAFFIAPKILGQGIPWTDYPAAQHITQALNIKPLSIEQIGDDILYKAVMV